MRVEVSVCGVCELRHKTIFGLFVPVRVPVLVPVPDESLISYG